ncbi:MAG: hypothetical protein IPL61_26105 [Myxococcales bacterium]|nr:hypothetical protein [Myxococcales bacterium]
MAAPTELAPLRVPCPLCRQPIHPIAGRCRHCKVDLTRYVGPPAAPPPTTRRPRLALVAALLVTIAIAIAMPLAGA